MPSVKNAWLRQRIIDQLLRSPRRRTVEEIREEVASQMGGEIALKTIYNDINNIKNEYGGEIVKDSLHKLSYKDRNFSIQNLPLNDEDKEMLGIASMILRTFKSSPILSKFESTIDKILTGTTIGKLYGREEMNYIIPDMTFGDAGYEWLEPIFKAIVERKAINLVYQKFGGEPKEKLISPYVLKEFRNHWYLIGYDQEGSKTTRVYALDRIRDIADSNKKYIVDENFDVDAYFKYCYGVFHSHYDPPADIELVIKPPFIDQVLNHPLHQTQEAKLNADKTELLVKIKVYDSPEIVREILSYGNKARVIKPLSLKTKIDEESRKD